MTHEQKEKLLNGTPWAIRGLADEMRLNPDHCCFVVGAAMLALALKEANAGELAAWLNRHLASYGVAWRVERTGHQATAKATTTADPDAAFTTTLDREQMGWVLAAVNTHGLMARQAGKLNEELIMLMLLAEIHKQNGNTQAEKAARDMLAQHATAPLVPPGSAKH